MKTSLALLALTSTLAFADTTTNLVDGDIQLSGAQGTIISVKPICPKNPNGVSCMAVGSKVKVNVMLNGCVDRLGGYSSRLEVVNGKGILYFSAINIHTENSNSVRCYARASQTVEVFAPFNGKIELVNLDYTALNNTEL